MMMRNQYLDEVDTLEDVELELDVDVLQTKRKIVNEIRT